MGEKKTLVQAVEELTEVVRSQVGSTPGATEKPDPKSRAFRWNPQGGFRRVKRLIRVDPDMLVGIERQKSIFFRNVQRFVLGTPALDVLLWGERGSGKSSLAAALLTRFKEDSLAMVSVREDHVAQLPLLLDALAEDARRWIIFFDDLGFTQEGQSGNCWHELKVYLEGGLETRPENTLAVATSNRRHMIAEQHPGELTLHPGDEAAEAASLADRFGIALGFYSLDQNTYLEAVEAHAKALGVALFSDWRAKALRWSMERGVRSGRAAAQFIRTYGG